MLSADDAAESAKALALLVQTLLKLKESFAKKPGLDPEVEKFLDLVAEAIALQAKVSGKTVDSIGRSIDQTGALIDLVKDLGGEVADLRQEVAQLKGE